MSRIGRKPVEVPKGVTVGVQDRTVTVNGPKGQLSLRLVDDVDVSLDDGRIAVAPRGDSNRLGIGLRGMRFRVESLGGQLEIEVNPERPSVVRASVPVSG